MNSVADVWTNVLQQLKKDLSETTITTWFDELTAVDIRENTFYLHCPNDFKKRYIESLFIKNIKAALQDLFSMEFEVKILDEAGLLEFQGGAPKKNSDRFTYEDFTFETFVVGPSNKLAYAASVSVAEHPAQNYNPLLIYGDSGLGKTHIMQSVGRAVQEQGNQARLAYLSAEDLASRYVSALRSNDVEGFRARLRDLDVLLLEDVHFLQGKEKMQDMVLTVIKSLQDRGGRAIFTSSFSPRELERLDSRLVSHFCSGIVSPLERPDAEMCRHILERKAKSFQVLLPDEVCDLLAGRLQGDVRQLESCLKSLVFKARMLNCGLNPELALEVLQQYATVDCGPDFASIVRLVCESYGLNERQLASRSHKQQYVLARNTIYYLARKHTDMSLKEIGERFNRRHSTVIKGITSLEREIANESRVGRQISRAVELIERNAGIRPEMSLAGRVHTAPHAAPGLLSL